MTGLIVDVQRASLHDGPGLRTTVFFKGCPLHCAWCHNPESIALEKQMLFYPEKCIGCGHCREGCFAGARVPCGREVTAEALLDEILQDKPFYRDEGGVTFSGGEPLMQRDFLRCMIALCRENGVRTAIETSLFFYDEDILSQLDLIMADLKIWDEDKHRSYCGGSARAIREHFLKAAQLGVPIIARTPIIPGINDDEEELQCIARFLAPLKAVQAYELLSYHPLGLEKARALGKPQTRYATPTPERMAQLRNLCQISRQEEIT